ncbi:Uncharacterized protein DBV15_10109 [Temnothorax longispinosus]|uniref:Uncharacterized protein n=1 Tax=Temnothorax longispinosus TaxID=300112 RepID=A0A4S2JBJ2_9HYME|nr:Uncharacterized protein DBV15_10109 [Temnothorax longispinosus]
MEDPDVITRAQLALAIREWQNCRMGKRAKRHTTVEEKTSTEEMKAPDPLFQWRIHFWYFHAPRRGIALWKTKEGEEVPRKAANLEISMARTWSFRRRRRRKKQLTRGTKGCNSEGRKEGTKEGSIKIPREHRALILRHGRVSRGYATNCAKDAMILACHYDETEKPLQSFDRYRRNSSRRITSGVSPWRPNKNRLVLAAYIYQDQRFKGQDEFLGGNVAGGPARTSMSTGRLTTFGD